jgi:hypothetical protein
MHRRFRFSLLLLAVAPAPALAQARRCGDATITGDRVGAVRIGMSLDSVRTRCRIIRDTTEMDEGEAGRVVYALVAEDTVRIDVMNNSVEFIRVRRNLFMTQDSIRAGMPLARFLIGRHPEILVGEGKVYLVDRTHCGISFGLSAEAYARARHLTEVSLARLPRSTVIDEILVIGISSGLPNERCTSGAIEGSGGFAAAFY